MGEIVEWRGPAPYFFVPWFLPLKASVRPVEAVGLGEVIDGRLSVGR